MKKLSFSILFVCFYLLASSQTWQTVIDDNPHSGYYTIYETSNQENLVVVDDMLHHINVNGVKTFSTQVDFSHTNYRDILFNSTNIYSFFHSSSQGISIRKFDYYGSLVDTMTVLNLDFTFRDVILNEDGSFVLLAYEDATFKMYAKSFDSNGIETNSTLLGSNGTRPRSIYKRPDGRYIASDASGNGNFIFLDENLAIERNAPVAGHIIHGVVENDQGRIYIAGSLGFSGIADNFIAEVDEMGNILNEYTFSESDFEGGGGWMHSLESQIFDLSLYLSTPELNDVLTLICLDPDLNVNERRTFYGDKDQISSGSQFFGISPLVPNQNGGYTFGYGLKYADGENYPLIVKTDDGCFVDQDIVLAIEEVNFNAERTDDKVLLTWDLEFSEDIENVEIQHSIDGKSFEVIDSDLFSNNATYQFEYLHQSPFIGSNYYRLKINFVSTESVFSELRYINIKSNDISVYPNPTFDFLHIEQEEEIQSVIIYNILGKQQCHTSLSENNRLDVSELLPGKYLIKIISGDTFQTKSFIKN